jgi:hypothetical protein
MCLEFQAANQPPPANVAQRYLLDSVNTTILEFNF